MTRDCSSFGPLVVMEDGPACFSFPFLSAGFGMMRILMKLVCECHLEVGPT